MNDSYNKDMELLKEACNKLSDHFCTVQIFATRHEMGSDDGTVGAHAGIGNWHARVGHVQEWIVRQDERLRQNVRNAMEDES